MIHSRAILGELIVAIPHAMFHGKNAFKKGVSLRPTLPLKLVGKATKY